MASMLSLPDMNPYLLAGAGLSFAASGLHILCIVGGPDYLRFFGAGEKFARWTEAGSWVPGVETLIIAGVLMVWGVYALAGAVTPNGAGIPMALPYLKWILAAITAVYLLCGIVFVPIYALTMHHINAFAIWSSLICLGYGIVHAVGLYQVWGRLA